jgi:hypothetical protein
MHVADRDALRNRQAVEGEGHAYSPSPNLSAIRSWMA